MLTSSHTLYSNLPHQQAWTVFLFSLTSMNSLFLSFFSSFTFALSYYCQLSTIYSSALLQTGLPLFQPIWASSVQCRHWTAGTRKKQALYRMAGWLTLAEQVQTPYHARVIKNTCKQMICFAQTWRKSVATPVKGAQQLGNQTEQVWRQIKPGGSYQTADSAASVSVYVGATVPYMYVLNLSEIWTDQPNRAASCGCERFQCIEFVPNVNSLIWLQLPTPSSKFNHDETHPQVFTCAPLCHMHVDRHVDSRISQPSP